MDPFLYCYSHCVCGFCVGSFYCNIRLEVLSSFVGNCGGQYSRLLYFYCIIDVLWVFVFCGSSSWVMLLKRRFSGGGGIETNMKYHK